ncbi:MAG: glycosyltransferase [Nitrososphaeraceae archaeon]|nr:glycosyltransferase [Nitrososphaeraceae archaeon]
MNELSVNSATILFLLLYPLPFPGAAWSRVSFFAKYLNDDSFFNVKIYGAFTPRSLSKAGRTTWNGIHLINCFPAVALIDPISFAINYISSIIVSFFIFAYLRPTYVFISVPRIGNSIGCYVSARVLGLRVITDYRDEWEDFLIDRSKSSLTRRTYLCLKNSMTQKYNKNFLVVMTTGSFAAGSNDLLIVYSGYIGGYYRIDLIIQSLHPDLKFLIVGRGFGINELFKQLAAPSIKDHVIYLGVKESPESVAQILSMCDTGIVPYDSNPLWKRSIPVKSLEYIACGLPIFATVFSDSELGSLIREYELGMSADPEDVQAITKVLNNLILCSDYRSKARIAGVKLAQSTFDRYHIAHKLKQVIVTDAGRFKK